MTEAKKNDAPIGDRDNLTRIAGLVSMALGIILAAYAIPLGSLPLIALGSALFAIGATVSFLYVVFFTPLKDKLRAAENVLGDLEDRFTGLESNLDGVKQATATDIDALRSDLRTKTSVESFNSLKQVVSTRASGEAINALKEAVSTRASGEALSTVKKELKETIGALRSLQTDMGKKASVAAISVVQSNMKRLEGRYADLKAEQSKKSSAQAVIGINDKISQIYERISEIREELPKKASAEALDGTKLQLRENSEDLSRRVANLQLHRADYHVHDRAISQGDIEEIISNWAEVLGVEQKEASLRYLADRIITLESLCHGRLATDIHTMIVRTLSALSVERDDISIVEIGTLFGIGAGAIYDACSDRFDKISLTLIDPLDGYYDRSSLDIITSVPVSRRVLDRNLRTMGVKDEDVTVIQGLSEAPETLAQVKNETYDILIIDGDHSYEGVKRDYENYILNVKLGGLVIFDDYDVEAWPDIKTYVDEEILPDTRVQIIATGYRTALARRVSEIQ